MLRTHSLLSPFPVSHQTSLFIKGGFLLPFLKNALQIARRQILSVKLLQINTICNVVILCFVSFLLVTIVI